MDELKLNTKLPTYDKEELDKLERISFEEKKKEFNRTQKSKELYNKSLNEFNKEKFELAKKLIKIGFSKDEIKKITKLTSKQLSIM